MKKTTIAALFVVLIAACTHKAPTTDIDKASAQFFILLRTGEFDRIYADSAQPFKDQNSRAQVVDDLGKMMTYGKPLQWRRLRMSFGDEGKVHVALPVYIVQSNTMNSEVSLKFGDIDGEWKLMGFAITPHGPIS